MLWSGTRRRRFVASSNRRQRRGHRGKTAGRIGEGRRGGAAQAKLTDLGLAPHVDAVGVAVLLDVVHPVNVGLQLRIDCGYAGSADELRDVTQTK